MTLTSLIFSLAMASNPKAIRHRNMNSITKGMALANAPGNAGSKPFGNANRKHPDGVVEARGQSWR